MCSDKWTVLYSAQISQKLEGGGDSHRKLTFCQLRGDSARDDDR